MVAHLFSQSGLVLRLRTGPLGSWVDLYLQRLHEDGYSEGSACHHVREIERFGRWLQRQRLETSDISPQLIKAYLANSRRLRPDRSSRGDGAALRRLLELLRKQGPHAVDQPILARMKRIGLERGAAFDLSSADPAVRRALAVPNPLKRFAIGDRDSFTFNADGSLEIIVAAADPGPDKK